MLPTVSVMTLNCWGGTRLDERRSALLELLRRFDPDILAVQEAPGRVQALIREALPAHQWVDDPADTWRVQGNVFWRGGLWHHRQHGGEPLVGMRDDGRWIQWVRLADSQRSVVVATAHYTWPGHPDEAETGLSPRVLQSRQTVSLLNGVAAAGEAVIFTGDLNDAHHPLRILASGGLIDCFTALGLPCHATRPARPLDERPDEASDWIVANRSVRAVAAQVVEFRYLGSPASDHWPVLALYRW